MSRFAEASARAGRAVPDDPRVDWTKERETAERLLSGGTVEQPTAERLLSGGTVEQPAPPPPAVSSPLPPDSGEQAFSWPPDFDLDGVDLSGDPHARDFRRPRPIMRRRVEVDDRTAPAHSPLRHDRRASLRPRATTVASRRGKSWRRLNVAHTVSSFLKRMAGYRTGR